MHVTYLYHNVSIAKCWFSLLFKVLFFSFVCERGAVPTLVGFCIFHFKGSPLNYMFLSHHHEILLTFMGNQRIPTSSWRYCATLSGLQWRMVVIPEHGPFAFYGSSFVFRHNTTTRTCMAILTFNENLEETKMNQGIF